MSLLSDFIELNELRAKQASKKTSFDDETDQTVYTLHMAFIAKLQAADELIESAKNTERSES